MYRQKVLPPTPGPPDQTACSLRDVLAGNQCEQSGQALPSYRTLVLEQVLPGHLRKSLLHWNQPQSLRNADPQTLLLETDSGALAWGFRNSMGDSDAQLGLRLLI